MRTYDEPIEVRRGLVAGQEAPEQFLWRGRLWVVRDVVSHWVETGAWWDQEGIAALLGVGAGSETEPSSGTTSTATSTTSSTTTSMGVTAVPLGADLLAESDVWRVEAIDAPRRRRSRVARLTKPPEAGDDADSEADSDFDRGYGVFDLAFDWTQARWRLIGCLD